MGGLKEFIKKVETSSGRVKRYSQFLTTSEINRIIYEENDCKKILVFQNVVESEASLVANTLGSKDLLAAALGCQKKDLHAHFLSRISAPLKPCLVDARKLREQQVNLLGLPVLKFSEFDAASYITAGIVIVKDLASGIQNASINRIQVAGKNELLIRAEPSSDLAEIIKRARGVSDRLPIAICLGNHPIELLAAASGLSPDVGEMWYAGSLHAESLPVIKTKDYGLLAPASSEIVLEGYLDLNRTKREGPFGDFLGFYVEDHASPVIKITYLGCAESPFYQTIRAGSLEDCILLGFWKEVMIYQVLKASGFDVVDVNIGPNVLSCRISLNKKYDQEVWEAARKAFEVYPWLKICILMDQNTDLDNESELWWNLANNWNTVTGSKFFKTIGVNKEPQEIYSQGIAIDATALTGTKTLKARPPL